VIKVRKLGTTFLFLYPRTPEGEGDRKAYIKVVRSFVTFFTLLWIEGFE